QTLIGNLPGFVASQNWFPQKGDIFWSPANWNGMAGLMNALLPTLYFGHAIVSTAGHLTPGLALDVMARYRVTNAFLPSAVVKLMMQESSADHKPHQLSLRAVMVSGESLDQAGYEWFRQTLGVQPNETFGQT